MAEKKSCPFCGADGSKAILNAGAKEGTTVMVCTKCWARGPEAESDHAARVLWNERKRQKRRP